MVMLTTRRVIDQCRRTVTGCRRWVPPA